ncbi:MAG TPA: hypothetical protein PK264_07205 [Hyphomicrobiaceae bacterium]|nr:hypothetical protein [Hyphomicrobiaceae bacterium]
MTKEMKTLSGAALDRYFRRVLRSEPALTPEIAERLAERLKANIASLKLRREAQSAEAADPAAAAVQGPVPGFDPYSPNLVVVVRLAGRDAALAALAAIESPDDLRLLAREQQLSVEPSVATPAELRLAIVAAAEQRIANRRAAARGA